MEVSSDSHYLFTTFTKTKPHGIPVLVSTRTLQHGQPGEGLTSDVSEGSAHPTSLTAVTAGAWLRHQRTIYEDTQEDTSPSLP